MNTIDAEYWYRLIDFEKDKPEEGDEALNCVNQWKPCNCPRMEHGWNELNLPHRRRVPPPPSGFEPVPEGELDVIPGDDEWMFYSADCGMWLLKSNTVKKTALEWLRMNPFIRAFARPVTKPDNRSTLEMLNAVSGAKTVGGLAPHSFVQSMEEFKRGELSDMDTLPPRREWLSDRLRLVALVLSKAHDFEQMRQLIDELDDLWTRIEALK